MDSIEEFLNILCGDDDSLPKNIFISCYEGNFIQVKKLIEEDNVNIYKIHKGLRTSRTTLVQAIVERDQETANYLLDIYERDLEVLKETKFTKALIAMPEDQTEELKEAVEDVASDKNVIPVLLKSNNFQKPKLVYLKTKNDSSLQLAKKLEEKNDFCDINWMSDKLEYPESALHCALKHRLLKVVDQLLKIPTINRKLINSCGDSPLKLAILYCKKETVEKITAGDYSEFWKGNEVVRLAISSKNIEMLDFVVSKMMKKKPLKEILNAPFEYDTYNAGKILSPLRLFHQIFDAWKNCRFFIKTHLPLDEEDFCIQDEDGDTILHYFFSSSCISET